LIISCIVAAAKNNVIGKDNDIPWYLPADLKYFKKRTLNHHIIMGRNCYESIGRPLPKRTNVILTRNPFYISTGCIIAHNVEEALEIAFENGETEAFIIGGGKIYEQTIDLWDRLYLTNVDLEVKGDVFFPELNMDHWEETFSEAHLADEKNLHNYTFKTYHKKN
jgi:dihydrofolate reductase